MHNLTSQLEQAKERKKITAYSIVKRWRKVCEASAFANWHYCWRGLKAHEKNTLRRRQNGLLLSVITGWQKKTSESVMQHQLMKRLQQRHVRKVIYQSLAGWFQHVRAKMTERVEENRRQLTALIIY